MHALRQVALLTAAVLMNGCVFYNNLFPPPRGPIVEGDVATRDELVRRFGEPLGTARLGDTEYLHFRAGVVALSESVVVGTWPSARSKNRYNVEVEAMAERHRAGAVFLAAVPPLSMESLEFRDVRRLLRPVLAERGYFLTDNAEQATQVVAVGFGISDPREWTELSYRPVVTYSHGTNTTFHVTCPGCVSVTGSIHTEGDLHTQYVPTTTRRRSYVRFLDLTAMDASALKSEGVVRETWRVRVRSEGPSGDVRLLLPVMVAASWSYIGTHAIQQHRLRYSDLSVQVVAVRDAGSRPLPSRSGDKTSPPAVGAGSI